MKKEEDWYEEFKDLKPSKLRQQLETRKTISIGLVVAVVFFILELIFTFLKSWYLFIVSLIFLAIFVVVITKLLKKMAYLNLLIDLKQKEIFNNLNKDKVLKLFKQGVREIEGMGGEDD